MNIVMYIYISRKGGAPKVIGWVITFTNYRCMCHKLFIYCNLNRSCLFIPREYFLMP